MTARPQDLVHVGARISFPDNGRSPEQVVTLSATIALTLVGGTVEQMGVAGRHVLTEETR